MYIIICFSQMSGAATSDQRAARSSKSEFILNKLKPVFTPICQEERRPTTLCRPHPQDIQVQSYWKKKSLTYDTTFLSSQSTKSSRVSVNLFFTLFHSSLQLSSISSSAF
mmetsp:Transcript_16268/g.24294  ORF Transcript_16268/g.24294 Transcript_16268/m.24294 type:complete len:110 (-) Transcript_16268:640-969(-)